MGHHMAHEEKHEERHTHYLCPQCRGEGWVEKQPPKDQEVNALRDYEEGLRHEIKAVQERVDELEHFEM
jgi:hypothetical protein